MSDDPLQGMSWDQRQELKEAVCDAVLDRTRRVVTGEGSHGAATSRVLSSGFILPRLNEDGDDESSDIRIASHGMDLRIRASDCGAVQVRPSFWVYVRALPTFQDLFARAGNSSPKPTSTTTPRIRKTRRSEGALPRKFPRARIRGNGLS